MLTMQEALNASEFHYGECKRTIGPRGGVTEHCERYRRNGRTQTWKTRPNEFRIPVVRGLKGYAQIRHYDTNVHTAQNCPLNEPYVTIGRPPFGTGRD